MVDIYKTLEVDENTPYTQLRSKCQGLLLKLHPDKNKGEESEDFLNVQKVWKILSNEKSFNRFLAEKSAELNAETRAVWKTIGGSEMTRRDGVLTYQCRCGDEFSLDKREETMEILILLECDTCSLMLEVDKLL